MTELVEAINGLSQAVAGGFGLIALIMGLRLLFGGSR